MARDDLLGADELGRGDGVDAVHRVVAADAHERDVDLVAAAGDELEVAEQRGVAEVVDDLAAEADEQAGGRVRRCRSATSRCASRATSLTQPQSNSTVPPMFGSKTWWSSPSSPEISLRELDDRDDRRAGALGDVDGVADSGRRGRG